MLKEALSSNQFSLGCVLARLLGGRDRSAGPLRRKKGPKLHSSWCLRTTLSHLGSAQLSHKPFPESAGCSGSCPRRGDCSELAQPGVSRPSASTCLSVSQGRAGRRCPTRGPPAGTRMHTPASVHLGLVHLPSPPNIESLPGPQDGLGGLYL